MTLVIFGPTATGKTNLAIGLAKKYNGELISADSRQVYKNLDIGTGKVSFESEIEKHSGYWMVDGVRINGFDLAQPGENFSVADFFSFSSTTLIRITKENKLPVIVGGSGFYIKALLSPIRSIGIPADIQLRNDLEKLSAGELLKSLLTLDPNRAKSMNESDRANPRRLIRAIEISTFNKSNVNKFQSNTKNKISNTKYLIIGLTAPNDFLYNKADKWLSERFEKGMIKEVQNLLEQGVDEKWLEKLGLEYRWITRFLLGQINKDEAVARLKGDIHSLIRRQKTWFKQFEKINILDISKDSWKSDLETKLLRLLY